MELGNVAPWKWGVLIGAGLLSVVVWFFALSGREKVEFADSMQFVDIETGQLFSFSTDRQLIMPEVNPTTGKRTLFEVYEDEDGSWMLDGRAVGPLRQNQSVKIKVDWETGRIETNGKEIQRVD